MPKKKQKSLVDFIFEIWLDAETASKNATSTEWKEYFRGRINACSEILAETKKYIIISK